MIQLHLHNGFTPLYCHHGKRTSSYKLLHINSVSEWPGEGPHCEGWTNCHPKVLSANYIPQFLIFSPIQY